MKKSDVIKFSVKDFIKTKSNYVSIIFMAVSASLIVFCLSFSRSLDDYWNKSVKKMVDYRTFFVYYDDEKVTKKEAMELLGKYKNIESISPYTSYLVNMRMFEKINNNIETNIFLFGVPKNTIKITHGKSIDDYGENENVMVCPEEIFYNIKKGQKVPKKSLNLIDNIGDYLNLKFVDEDLKTEKFKLVGTYDSSTRQGKENFCYTNSNVVTYLNLHYQPDAFKEEPGILYPLIVRLKDTDCIKETLQQLKKDGFYTNGEPVVKIDTTVGDKILNLVNLISLLVILISIVINILIFAKSKNKKQKKYAILKTLGYNHSEIIKLQFCEMILCLLVTIPIMLIINYNISLFFQMYYIQNEDMLYGLKLIISKTSVLLGITFCFIFNILLLYIYDKFMIEKTIVEEIED